MIKGVLQDTFSNTSPAPPGHHRPPLRGAAPASSDTLTPIPGLPWPLHPPSPHTLDHLAPYPRCATLRPTALPQGVSSREIGGCVHFAGVQYSSAIAKAMILRGPGGFQLSRLTVAAGRSQAQLRSFASLYDLLIFARVQGFGEVDPDAQDWQPVAAS